MATQATRLRINLPPFKSGRTEWRRLVHRAILGAKLSSGVRFVQGQPVAVTVRLLLPPAKFHGVDLDNRVKHIMDALQGAIAGEGKKTRRHKRLIGNDGQVCRIKAEKIMESRAKPNQPRNGGYVVVQAMGRS